MIIKFIFLISSLSYSFAFEIFSNQNIKSIVENIDFNNFKILIDGNDEKIINGELAQPAEFPFMASIGFLDSVTYSHRCGATILNNKYIMTAAHCVQDLVEKNNSLRQFEQVFVTVVGTNHISSVQFKNLSQNGQVYQIDKIIINESYSNTTDPNDIAVLTVFDQIVFNSNTSAVRLPESNDPSVIFGKNVTIIGWGQTETGFSSNNLLKAQMTVLNSLPQQTQCEGYDKEHYCIKDLGGDDSNVCFGDSGGPLIYKFQNEWVQYGITSFGFADIFQQCDNTRPSFFAMVPRLLTWLNEQGAI